LIHSRPTPGPFSYGRDPGTFLQVFVWNGTRPVWRGTPWTNSSDIFYMAVVNTEDDMYLTYGGLAGGAAHNRYVLTHSGEFLLQSWNSTSAAWMDLRRWASWACNRYGHCGPYGYCDNTVAAPTCRCLDGFEPADPEEWSGGSFSRGCRLAVALQCGDGFLALPGMKSPDKFVLCSSGTRASRSAAGCAPETALAWRTLMPI